MKTAQNPLQLKLPEPEISPEDVKRLLRTLVDGGGCMTAAQIAGKMFGLETESLKRRVRASAARPRIVSFPGSQGYKLWECCTVEEIQHGIAALESQGKDMIRDANLYRMAYHRGFRPACFQDQTMELFPR